MYIGCVFIDSVVLYIYKCFFKSQEKIRLKKYSFLVKDKAASGEEKQCEQE